MNIAPNSFLLNQWSVVTLLRWKHLALLKQVDSMTVFPFLHTLLFFLELLEGFFPISFGSMYLSKCFIRPVRCLPNFFSDLICVSDNLTIPFHLLTTSFSELALSSFVCSKLKWLFPWPAAHCHPVTSLHYLTVLMSSFTEPHVFFFVLLPHFAADQRVNERQTF